MSTALPCASIVYGLHFDSAVVYEILSNLPVNKTIDELFDFVDELNLEIAPLLDQITIVELAEPPGFVAGEILYQLEGCCELQEVSLTFLMPSKLTEERARLRKFWEPFRTIVPSFTFNPKIYFTLAVGS